MLLSLLLLLCVQPGSQSKAFLTPAPLLFSFLCSIVIALLVICVHELVLFWKGKPPFLLVGQVCVHGQVIPTSKSRQNRTTTSRQQSIRQRKQNCAKTTINKGERERKKFSIIENPARFSKGQHPCYHFVCLFVLFCLTMEYRCFFFLSLLFITD